MPDIIALPPCAAIGKPGPSSLGLPGCVEGSEQLLLDGHALLDAPGAWKRSGPRGYPALQRRPPLETAPRRFAGHRA